MDEFICVLSRLVFPKKCEGIWLEQVVRLLTQQTPRLHSDGVFKSPGTQPPTQPASWLPEWPPQTPRVTRAKHSSTGLKIVGGGRGLWLLNTRFIKRTSGLVHTHAPPCHAYSLSILAPYFPFLSPLSSFIPCHPKPNARPPFPHPP